MELKIMEWNIHQQGRQFSNGSSTDGIIPLWIVDSYITDDINIVIFTEFNSHAQNISEIYNHLALKGFCYSTTSYTCPWSNDILIAVRGNDIELTGVSYVKSYADNPNTTFELKWDMIPENLRVDIRIAEIDLHLWGIRIKDLENDYNKRKIEMETVMNWLTQTEGYSVVLGDFNNLRENTPQKAWNLKVLDELLGDSFIRKTPNNNSWGVSKSDKGFDGYIKNDHLIISKQIKATVEEYEWDFLDKVKYKLKDPVYDNGKQELVIPVRNPDHGRLLAKVKLDI